jgi:hypothetical protein
MKSLGGKPCVKYDSSHRPTMKMPPPKETTLAMGWGGGRRRIFRAVKCPVWL